MKAVPACNPSAALIVRCRPWAGIPQTGWPCLWGLRVFKTVGSHACTYSMPQCVSRDAAGFGQAQDKIIWKSNSRWIMGPPCAWARVNWPCLPASTVPCFWKRRRKKRNRKQHKSSNTNSSNVLSVYGDLIFTMHIHGYCLFSTELCLPFFPDLPHIIRILKKK